MLSYLFQLACQAVNCDQYWRSSEVRGFDIATKVEDIL